MTHIKYQIKRGKSKIVTVYAMKAHRRSTCMAPLILNLDARRRRVVNIRARPL